MPRMGFSRGEMKAHNRSNIGAMAQRRLAAVSFIVVVVILLSRVNADGARGSSQENRHLAKVRAYGANPVERYPLAKCQGDCDLDSQCRGRLVCLQRTRNQPVPGCEGGREDRTPSDYCIDPYDSTVAPNLNFLGINPPRQEFPLQECEGDCDRDSDCAPGLVCQQRRQRNISVPGCEGSDSGLTDYCIKRSNDPNPRQPPPPILDFSLKMYWQRNYRWQEETFDRRWCMKCRTGDCNYGDKTYIDTCDPSSSQRYDFVFVDDDDVLIRLHGTDLCFERISNDIFLYECDTMNQRQYWFAQQGDFRGSRFEISPSGKGSHCITQRHHPKFFEEVELEPCSRSRGSDTSFWIRY